MSPRLSDLFLSSQSDERLVALARAGNERAFVAIVERYRPELQALARRLCADGRSEDVVQQAFLSAFAALRSGAEVKHLRGWLYRITRNAAYGSRAPVLVPLDAATASPETVEDIVQQRAVALSALNELARLPARQRQAMVGTVRGMGRSEVAGTMGLSEGAVRQLVHRARATLRTAVTAVTPWPLARWFAALGQSSPGSAELAAGAGAVSSGSIALKLGALVASWTLATGVAAVDLHGAGPHRSGARHAAREHAHASVHRGALGVSPAVGPSIALAAGSSRHFVSVRVGAASPAAGQSGGGFVGVSLRNGRQEPGDVHSGTRHDGHHDGSHGDDGGSRGSQVGAGNFDAGRGGRGDQTPSGSGSTHRGGGGGRDGGGSGHGDGSGQDSSQPSGSIADAGSHGDGGDQASVTPQVHDSAADGSSSDLASSNGGHSGSGDGSRSRGTSQSGSDSGGGSGSSSGSGSGSRSGSGFGGTPGD
jgi:RNA polymerase sigma factor (sigma-70 family)